MIFYEKTSGLGFLKSSYGSSYSDMFCIVEDTRLNVHFRGVLTSLLTYIRKSIGSDNTLTETVTSLDQYSKGNGTSLTPYLPWWDIKTIEVVGPDVGDISIGQ